MNKKGQLISLFWGALLIFIDSVSIYISLIIISRDFASRERISDESFQTDFFGPVIPVLINSDLEVVKMLDDLVLNPGQASQIYNYFENKLNIFGYKSLDIRIVSEINEDNYFISNEEYKETFYYIYNSTKFLKIDLVMDVE